MFLSSFVRPAAALVTTSFLSMTWSQNCPEWSAAADQEDARLGAAVASAGDVNDDGYDDVLVGAPLYDNGESTEGRAYLYLGSSGGPSTTPAWTVESDQAGAQLGTSLSGAGDVNGDGYADVIVGAPFFANGQASEGIANVYLGSSTGPATIADWVLECDQANARFGESVSAGDFNGDGYGDVVVGARLFDNGQSNEGRAFVYLGSASGLSLTPVWTAESDDAGATFGRVAGAGDVNGDGYDDVLVGSQGDGHGRAYLYFGSSSGPETAASWVEDGEAFSSGFFGLPFGDALDGAGDVNDDGYDDVLVADPVWDLSGVKVGGKAYLYLGSASGLATTPAWTRQGTEEGAKFGASVAGVGDVNADGFDDWVVSNHFQLDGELRVYFGTSGTLPTATGWTFPVPAAELEAFGGAAGDVNGDGHPDVVVGSNEDESMEPDDSHVEVYLGSVLGFVRSEVFTGDGINLDLVEPLNIELGSVWSAPLTIGGGTHGHGAGGPVTLTIRTATVNGPNITSPFGGRQTENLISGPVLARIGGTHDGAEGDIPAQAVPNDPSLLGVPWAAQYVVLGGGFADFSRAVRGVITQCP